MFTSGLAKDNYRGLFSSVVHVLRCLVAGRLAGAECYGATSLFCLKNRHFESKGPVNPRKHKCPNFCIFMFANRWNSRAVWEMGVEDHNGDVRCQTGSRNKHAVSHMRIGK